MSDASKQAIRDLLAIQCKATATLQLQMAAALVGKGQDQLREHFMDSARVLVKAATELKA